MIKNLSILLNRRQFLKVAGLTTGAVVAGSGTAFASLPQRRPALARTADRTKLVSAPENTINTACHMCSNYCGATAVFETVDGVKRVRRLEAMPNHPNARGGICAKGQSSVQQLYDADRLKAPVRKKADGSWEELSWDAALTHVAQKLQAIRGTTAVSTDSAAQLAAGKVYFMNRRGAFGDHFGEFRKEFGSKNFGSSATVCDGAKRFGTWMGIQNARVLRDPAEAEYTIIFGRNDMATARYRLGIARETVENMKRAGTKTVVVDPRYTYTASKADQWVPIKPGTDLLFILSICRVILDNTLTPAAKVADADVAFRTEPAPWAKCSPTAQGLKQFKDEVMKDIYDPANAAPVCGVDASTIETLAQEFTTKAPKVVADTAAGLAKFSNGTMTNWALLCLNGLANNFVKGGYVNPQSPSARNWSWGTPSVGTTGSNTLQTLAGWPHQGDQTGGVNNEGFRWLVPFGILNGLPTAHPDFRKVPVGPYTHVLNNSANAVVDGNVYGGGRASGGGGIRGLFLYNTDPFIADSETGLWEKALPKTDFAVAIDLYITATHELFPPGSVVLPETTMLERTNYAAPTGPTPVINLQQKVVEPLHQSKSAHWILIMLAKKMSALYGVNGGYFDPNAAAASYDTASPSGRIHKQDENKEADYARARLHNQVLVAGTPATDWANLTANGGWAHPDWDNRTVYPKVGRTINFGYPGTEGNVNVQMFRQMWEHSKATSWDSWLVPHWRAPEATTSKYPLRFMAGGKTMWHTMGATANLPYLVQNFNNFETGATNYLLINPVDAAARGLTDGTWAVVASKVGKIRVQAKVTPTIRPGFVSVFSGFGHKAPTQKTANNRGVNPAYLISSLRYDRGNGQVTSNEEPVQVFKA